MHEQLIAGCKKAIKKVIIYCWHKDLDTNLIRDNTFLDNYDVEFEDDKAEKAIDIVQDKVNMMINTLKDGLDDSNFSDGVVSMMRDLFNLEKSLPKNFLFSYEIERVKFNTLGSISK